MRKIIQIAASDNSGVVVLCDDGIIWRISGGVWFQYPSIPQDSLK